MQLFLAAVAVAKAAALSPMVVRFSAAPQNDFASTAPTYRFLYDVMRDDEARTKAYQRAIESPDRGVRGKVVLEIGTGALALLAIMCARAGARHVIALEVNAEACAAAQIAVTQAGFADQITVVQGHSALLADLPRLPGETGPAQVDVVVSELVGNIATTEGAAQTLRDAKRRFLREGAGWSIPFEIATFALPVRFPSPLLKRFAEENSAIAAALAEADAETLAALVALRPEMALSQRKHVFKVEDNNPDLLLAGFPAQLALSSTPQLCEFVSFDADIVDEHSRTTAEWNMDKAGFLDGFIFFNALSCERRFDVTSLDPGSNWQPILLDLAGRTELYPGDLLRLEAHSDLSRPQSTYTWEVSVQDRQNKQEQPLRTEAEAEWRRRIQEAAAS